MSELKSCPFCRSKAGIQQDITGKERYHVVCNSLKCKCPMISGMPWRNTPEEAADDWNRRADGWIPVEERLPPKGECLVAYADGTVRSASVIFGEDFKHCTHWQPLPEPPREKAKGND